MFLSIVVVGWLMVQQCVGPDYEPTDLGVWDGPSYRQIQGTSNALASLEPFFNDLEERGMRPVLISGYRSYQEQEVLHQRDPKWTELPGCSEHQLGTAFDVSWMGYGLRQPYEELYDALENLGPDYGFTVTYDGSGDIPSEPWHINYQPPERKWSSHTIPLE